MSKLGFSAVLIGIFAISLSPSALADPSINESFVVGKGIQATGAASKDADSTSSTGATLGAKAQLKGALNAGSESREVILDTDLNASVGVGAIGPQSGSGKLINSAAAQAKTEADLNVGIKLAPRGSCGLVLGTGLGFTGQYLGNLTSAGSPLAEVDTRLRLNAGLGCSSSAQNNIFLLLPQAGAGIKTELGAHASVGGRMLLGIGNSMVATMEVVRKYGVSDKVEDQAKFNAGFRVANRTWLGLDAAVTQLKSKGADAAPGAPEPVSTSIYGGVALGVAAF